MLKRTTFFLVFFVSACVTVNIYFPAAAVERAAEQIVKETWGDPSKNSPAAGTAQQKSIFAVAAGVSEFCRPSPCPRSRH